MNAMIITQKKIRIEIVDQVPDANDVEWQGALEHAGSRGTHSFHFVARMYLLLKTTNDGDWLNPSPGIGTTSECHRKSDRQIDGAELNARLGSEPTLG